MLKNDVQVIFFSHLIQQKTKKIKIYPHDLIRGKKKKFMVGGVVHGSSGSRYS